MHQVTHSIIECILILLLLSLSSCVSPTADSFLEVRGERNQVSLLTGTIQYPNNLYFPSRIRVDILLRTFDIINGNTQLLASQSIRNPSLFPINFVLRYDPAEILDRHEIILSVSLYKDEEKEPYLVSDSIRMPRLSGEEHIIIELKPL